MENLKEKVAIVIDEGIFLELAVRLSRDFKKVYYFSSWTNEFPYSKDDKIGEGIEGIERVSSLWKAIYDADEEYQIDIFIFPSIYQGWLQLFLRDKLGKRVWGSGNGDELELYREKSDKVFKKLGLPRPTFTPVTGVDAARKFLKANNDKYIKHDVYRGDFETLHHEEYWTTKPVLDDIEAKVGDHHNEYDFLIYDPLDGEEWGWDGFSIDGQYPKTTIFGMEIKALGYACHVKDYKDISPLITDFNDKISGELKKYKYRNFLSTEIRIGKDKIPYMIDFCARQPSPPGELYQEMCKNLAEIIWYGAEGILIEPEFEAPYGVQIMMNSSWAENRWQGIKFPESIRRWVKLRCAEKVGDTYYIIPRYQDLPEIGAIVRYGKSIEECVELINECVELIKGPYIDVKTGCIDNLMEAIQNAKSIGISF